MATKTNSTAKKAAPISRGTGIVIKSVTDQIKDVLQAYPLGTNVLKELLQNGDDAKARYMTYMLDLRTHKSDRIIKETLSGFQGPALLAFDSAIFPQQNFESMCRIADSAKKFDPTKTGKFGLGSYSSYQITDVLSFLSESSVRYVDPQRKFIATEQQQGSTFDMNESYHFTEEFSDSCSVFCPGFEWCPPHDKKKFTFEKKDFFPGSSYQYPGTIIRLALRNEAQSRGSDLSNQIIEPAKMEEILRNFSKEVAQLLLFLRHVEGIRILIWRRDAKDPEEILNVNIKAAVASADASVALRQSRRAVNGFFEHHLRSFGVDPEETEGRVRDAICQMMKKYKDKKLVRTSPSCAIHFNLEIFEGSKKGTLQRWVLSFHFADPDSPATQLCIDAVDPTNMLSYAKLKLIPWAMVAGLVEIDGQPAVVKEGRPYMTMPVGGLITKLPVHVNSCFEVGSSRQELFNTPNCAGADLCRYTWNHILVSELIPKAYVAMFDHLLHSDLHFNLYDLFPPPSENLSDIWNDVVGGQSSQNHSFYHIYAQRPLLHPTGIIAGSGKALVLYSVAECYFQDPDAADDVNQVLVQFLRDHGEKVVTPMSSSGQPLRHIYNEFARCLGPANVKIITPSVICDVLLKANGTVKKSGTMTSSLTLCKTILQYFLSTKHPFDWMKLNGIPLIPLKDGSLGVFEKRQPTTLLTKTFYIPKNDVEEEVFNYVKHLYADFDVPEMNERLCMEANVEFVQLREMPKLKAEFDVVLRGSTGILAVTKIWEYLGKELEALDAESSSPRTSPRTGGGPTGVVVGGRGLLTRKSSRLHANSSETVLRHFQNWPLFFNRKKEPLDFTKKETHRIIRIKNLQSDIAIIDILEFIGCHILHTVIDNDLDDFHDIEEHYVHASSVKGVLDAVQGCDFKKLDAGRIKQLLEFFANGFHSLDTDDQEKLRTLPLFKLYTSRDENDKSSRFTAIDKTLSYVTYIGDVRDVHPILCPPNRCLSPLPDHKMAEIYKALGITVHDNGDRILLDFGFDNFHLLKQEKERSEQIIKILREITEKSEEFKKKLAATKFVPLRTFKSEGSETSLVYRALTIDPTNPQTWIIDPTESNPIRRLFEFDTEPYFPRAPYRQHLDSLKALGLVSKLNRYGVINRAQFIAKLGNLDNAKILSTRLMEYLRDNGALFISSNADTYQLDMPMDMFREALSTIPWLLTELTENPLLFLQGSIEKGKPFAKQQVTQLSWPPLGAAKNMRPYSDNAAVYLTMPLLNHSSEVVLSHPSIREFFNWDKPPPIAAVVGHLLKVKDLYLKKAVEYSSNRKGSTSPLATLSRNLDDLLRSPKGCYTTLLSYVDTSAAELRAALNNQGWIFHHQHQQWVSPLNCAYSAKHELPPYLCKLPSAFIEMRKLTDIFGVQDLFSPDSFVKCLADISDKHASISKPLTEELLGHVISALKGIVEFGKKSENQDWWDSNKGNVKIPSSTMYMVTPQSGFYIDNKGLFDKVGAAGKTIIHSEVTVDIASALRVRPFSSSLASEDAEESSEEDVGQKIDLSAFLRTNLENYPRNSVLKEMLQNADDAGADSFVVLYDKRYHPTDTLIAYRGLMDEDMRRDLQGPAILVQNNGVMKEKDIKAIREISQSSKKGDHSKIGKFGLGFNSVYHITDTPSFLTGDSLYIFDPSQKYLHCDKMGQGKVGSKFKMSERFPISPNQFLPFTSQHPTDDFLAHYPKEYNGTLFRLPLRTTKQIQVSSLGRPEFTDKNVMELLSELRDNMANICLFLKNVRSIRILQWETGQGSPTLLCSCTVKDSDNTHAYLIPRTLQRNKEDLYADVKKGSVQSSTWIREISIAFDASSPGNVLRYLMSARFGANIEYKKMYDHMDNNRERGFLPIAGIAALIGSSIRAPVESYTKSISGMTFCFLPLPIRTDFPVQINAYFAVTTDRQAINNKEEMYKTWNSLLRDYVISPLYAQLLLEARDHLSTEEYYKLFPKTVNVSGLDLYFDALAKQTYKTIISSQYPTFQLKTAKLQWNKVDDVMFYSSLGDIHDVLIEDNFPLTFAPAFVYEECKAVDSARVQNCSPLTVKAFYAQKWTEKFAKRMYGTVKEVEAHRIRALVSKETVKRMLSYILLSDRNQFQDADSLSAILENSPFLTLASGDIGVFKRAARPSFTAVMIPVSAIDLIPEALHRCVLQEDMGLFEQHIANWNDLLNIPKLDLDLLAKLMDEGAPTILRKARQQKLPYLDLEKVPKDAVLQLKNWLLKFYAFLSTYNPLNEQKFIELFESWPILLAKVHGGGQRLYTLANRKLILVAVNSGFSAQAAECFNILHTKLSCPVIVMDNGSTAAQPFAVVNQFLNSLVGQMKCLEVLNLIEQGAGVQSNAIDRLSAIERDFLLKTCIDTRPNSASDSAIFVSTIKKFPFFVRADGTYDQLGEKTWSLLPSETLPVTLEGDFLLSDERFNDFYVRDLKIKKLTLVDCYKFYILKPEIFDKFTDQHRMNVMAHVKINQGQLLKDSSIVQAISSLQCIIVGDQRLRPIDCFDPTHHLFSCFFAHKCLPINSPPYSNNTTEWLNFLRLVGLRKDLSQISSSSSTTKVLTAEDILLSVAQAIERATVSPKPTMVAGTVIGIRNKLGRIEKASIAKIENAVSSILVSGKYVSVKTSAIIAPWCEDAMCEPISDLLTIPLLDEKSIPTSVKGVFYFLAELTKAFVNKLLHKPFFSQLAKISCIPLLYKMKRRMKAFGTPSDIANSAVCDMVPSCYPTYFGLDYEFNWNPMRDVWNGKFPLEMEEAMGMVTKISTTDLLSHIKYLVGEGGGEIRRISQIQSDRSPNFTFKALYNLFDNYKRNLIELQSRDGDFATIQKELIQVPFIWIYENSLSRLLDVKNSYFDMKRAFGTGYFSHITPDLPFKRNSQKVGYACSIPENLAEVKPFLTKMGVRDLPAKSDLLGYLKRLKIDAAATTRSGEPVYTGEEVVLLSSLILKVLSVVAPNEKLSPDVFLPSDSKMSATSEDSYMFSYPDESVRLLPAKELILFDDENFYKRESLLNFDLIRFFTLNEEFHLEDIQGVLPLLSLREVIQTKPINIGATVRNADIVRINELMKDPEFLCALFRLKFNDLEQQHLSQIDKLKLRSIKWRLGDVCKFVQAWLPAEIILNESIQVAYILNLNNVKVNITSDRFYKTDSLYITKAGGVRKNKDDIDKAVKVEFFEFANGVKGPSATIPVSWKSSYETKFFIIDIVTDVKSGSELVVFKPENLHVRETLCFVNPKMPCSRDTVDSFVRFDADGRRILHVANSTNSFSNSFVIKVSLSIDKNCLVRTKQPFPQVPGISFANPMSGETMDTFRALLMNPPTKFASILKNARIPYLEIHSQEPGDVLSATEIKDLYFPHQGEEIRFFQNDVVAVKGKAELGQGDVVYRYARVRSILQSVLTVLVSLEPDETTEEFGPAKYPIVFKLKKDIPAMKIEIEQERFTAEVTALCVRDIDESSIELITAFLSELEGLVKKGQDLSMKIPPMLTSRIERLKDLLKFLKELRQAMEKEKEKEKEKIMGEGILPPPPPSEEDLRLANEGGEAGDAPKEDAEVKDGSEGGGENSKLGDNGEEGGSTAGGDTSTGKVAGGGGGKGGEDGPPLSDEEFDKALNNAESGCHDTVLKAIDDVKKRKEDGEELDDSHTCHRDAPEEHIVVTNRSYHGIAFWISRDVEQTPQEVKRLDQAADTFARLLLHIRGHAFQLTKVNAIKIFFDPKSESIAFNCGATLFFNLHYWLKFKHGINTGDSLYFWFHTFCHEVAHNVVHNHGVGHNYALQCLATKKSIQLYAQKDKVKGK